MSQALLVIDTETGFIDRFTQKLDDEGILDQYPLCRITPDTTIERYKMVERCADAVFARLEFGIAAIFVDIVIVESGGKSLDTSGIAIAHAIRTKLPTIPLFFVTGQKMNDGEAEALSEASLQDVDGVLLKVYLDGEHFSTKRLRAILVAGRRKRESVGKTPIPVLTGRSSKIDARLAFLDANIDPRVRPIIRDIGEDAFWYLVAELMPDVKSGALRYMKPGRSGAYVFRAAVLHSLTDQLVSNKTEWIFKISRDEQQLVREGENYGRLAKTGVTKASFPHLLTQPIWLGDVGGLVVELQSDSVSVAEFLTKENREVASLRRLESSLIAAMSKLHGKGDSQIARVWNRYFELKPGQREAVLSFLCEHETIISEKVSQQVLQRTTNFVVTGGEDLRGLCDYTNEALEVFSHNDLNTGNVLVMPDGFAILIDFASMGRGHAAVDFAKFDRDLFYRVDGYGTEKYFSWLPAVAGVNAARGHLPDRASEMESRIHNVRGVMRRSAFEKHAVPLEQYHMALLSTGLAALANQSLPVPRRVAGVAFVAELIEMIREELS